MVLPTELPTRQKGRLLNVLHVVVEEVVEVPKLPVVVEVLEEPEHK